jgi:hypothetical protein
LKYNRKLPKNMLEMYPEECQIIMMMTNKNPEMRPSAKDLIKS